MYPLTCVPKKDSDQPAHLMTWPRGYKTFFMLNSTEHELCPAKNLIFLTIASSFLLNMAEHENFSANKYENANFCWHFYIY